MNTKLKISAKFMVIVATILSSLILIGTSGQSIQQVKGQTQLQTDSNSDYKNNLTKPANSTVVIQINPSNSTTKEFWINTVHFDGMTNINAVY